MKTHNNLWASALLLLAASIPAFATIRYVDINSASPMPPYTNWATAATNIQDAVDAAAAGDQVLVTNGVYQTGGRWATLSPGSQPDAYYMSNRLVVMKAVRVESVNGPASTMIVGYQVPGITANGEAAVRCVLLSGGARLTGFTLTNGATRLVKWDDSGSGGGVCCKSTSEVVSNCVLIGNSAAWRGGGSFRGTLNNCVLSSNSVPFGNDSSGGGAFGGTLNRCVLIFNRAPYGTGGGAAGDYSNECKLYNCKLVANSANRGGAAGGAIFRSDCYLNNCTLTGNDAFEAGGVYCCSVFNSIVYDNTAFVLEKNYDDSSRLGRSCTFPLPAILNGNITNAPMFVDQLGGNLRLQSNSPCINAGANSTYGLIDLDGNARIKGVHVDIGAYEFQGTGLSDFTGWLWQFGLPTDGTADYSDSDSDLMNNWQEWIAGTIPTDALSALRLLTPTPGVFGTIVSWQSVSNRMYFLERATNLGAQTPFSLLANNITGQAATTSYTDTNAVGPGPFFYRVGVQQ